ncbi:DUF1697 domain-containing protein [Piscinibacter sp. XHJ-5]|uniref:DUF1697 domain-containing protein n=1 Tax=Piscinibacter sp. XHJ-5 TaxID=3037797 RepID=UPI0024534751|nr:DUF1697 domain-containing protein [Piscinibacter sp. XHJ-5]
MPSYVAFLRGISPMNAKMPELQRCFEAAGFTGVKTVLASGNIVFGARAAAAGTLERKAETAMAGELGHSFRTIVRPTRALRELLEADPFADFRLPAEAKRVVTFLRKPQPGKLSLPIETDGAHIVGMNAGEVFTAYVPSARGAVFMRLIEKTFGTEVTTRTWDTIRKCVAAADRT